MFQSSCQYIEVQEHLAALLGPHGINSKIPVTPIAAFAANTNTEMAYEQFWKDLYQIGVTEDIIRQNEDEIREILKSQGMVTNSQIAGNNVEDKDRILEVAYKRYCNTLYRLGFTEDTLPPKDKILRILRSRGVVASSQRGGGNSGEKSQLQEARCSLLTCSQPLIYI